MMIFFFMSRGQWQAESDCQFFLLTNVTGVTNVASVKQIRLTGENEIAVNKLVKAAKLDILTVPGAANMAIKKGLPQIRRLFIKSSK